MLTSLLNNDYSSSDEKLNQLFAQPLIWTRTVKSISDRNLVSNSKTGAWALQRIRTTSREHPVEMAVTKPP